MSLTSLVMITSATAAVAFAISLIVGTGLRIGARRLDALAPAAQSRLLLLAALLPALGATALMTAALAPSFGWIADHCFPPSEAHAHPHICTAHQAPDLPGLLLLLLATVLVARIVMSTLTMAHAFGSGYRSRRELARIARPSDKAAGALLLPIDAPQAFLLGLWSPTLFVTRALVESPEHLAPVLAHERAHLVRRDTFFRFIAIGALAFHLPGISRLIRTRLTRAQEMAADAIAAAELGNERVARALVYLARARVPLPHAACGFAMNDIEARVRRLLDPTPPLDGPGARTLMSLAMIALGLVGIGADFVHHGVEILVGALGG